MTSRQIEGRTTWTTIITYQLIQEVRRLVRYDISYQTVTERTVIKRTRRLPAIRVDATSADRDGGVTLSATFDVPAAYTAREQFEDTDGFPVPPSTGPIFGEGQGQIISATWTPVFTYRLGKPLELEVSLSDDDSIALWGRLRLDVSPWYGGSSDTITENAQRLLDATAAARQQHDLSFSAWQDTVAESVAAIEIDTMSYLDLAASYPSEGIDISAVVLVMERQVDWAVGRGMTIKLSTLETGTVSADIPAGTPRDFAASAIDAVSVALSWERGTGRRPSLYTYRWRIVGTSDWTEGTTGTTDATVTGLTHSTEYEFQVKADDSDWTESVTATTLAPTAPGVPEMLTVMLSGNSAIVAWAAPSSGGVVTGYRVRHRVSGTGSWTTGSRTDETSVTIAGLASGTKYEFQAQSLGIVDNSPWTASATATTGLPSITNLRAVNRMNTSLGIAWDAVAGATGYDVQWRAPGQDYSASTRVTSPSITITGLVEDTNYDVRVRSVTGFTASEWTSISTATTSTLVPPVPTVVPSPADEFTRLRVTFDPVDGALSYNIRYRETGTTQWTLYAAEVKALPNFNDITGLDEGTSYDVQTLVTNAGGPSDWSATVTGSTKTTTPVPAAEAVLKTEDGFDLLLEDGSHIELEDSVATGFDLLDEEGDALLLEDGSKILLERTPS